MSSPIIFHINEPNLISRGRVGDKIDQSWIDIHTHFHITIK